MSHRSAAVVIACLAALAGCGTDGGRHSCAAAGFSGGSSAADGVFFAVVPRDCVAAGGRAQCAIADGTSVISREVVPAGVVQDCVAFNQFAGSGLGQIPGYVTGECFGRAHVAVAGALRRRTRFAPRRCLESGRRVKETGPPPAPMVRPAQGAVLIEQRVADPWGRAPETGAVGARRRIFVPPWAVLLWRGRDGSTCYEAGQYVDAATPGRSDELPGVRARGRLRRSPQVGSLRYDSRSGVGTQLYGIGRFTEYPRSEGASCGDPRLGAGLLASRTDTAARRDLSLGHVTVAGVAGPRVRDVWLTVTGRAARRLALGPSRSFLAVLRPGAASLALRVTYREGAPRRLAL